LGEKFCRGGGEKETVKVTISRVDVAPEVQTLYRRIRGRVGPVTAFVQTRIEEEKND
jgi:hypothetical protein